MLQISNGVITDVYGNNVDLLKKPSPFKHSNVCCISFWNLWATINIVPPIKRSYFRLTFASCLKLKKAKRNSVVLLIRIWYVVILIENPEIWACDEDSYLRSNHLDLKFRQLNMRLKDLNTNSRHLNESDTHVNLRSNYVNLRNSILMFIDLTLIQTLIFRCVELKFKHLILKGRHLNLRLQNLKVKHLNLKLG